MFNVDPDKQRHILISMHQIGMEKMERTSPKSIKRNKIKEFG